MRLANIKSHDWSYKTFTASLSQAAMLSALSLTLAACGGNSSSPTATVPPTLPVVTDTTAPVIELTGFETVEVLVGGLYFDPGATAFDNVDGDISGQITASSTVNTAITGAYEVTYTVSDAAGNAAPQVKRTVNVVMATDKQQYGANGFVQIQGGFGGFPDIIDPGDRFGRDHDIAGDIDNDGISDLVIGARSDDDGAVDAGAVYIAFMNADGTVRDQQKISMLEGGFTDTLEAGNFFGYGVAGIGDYDGDGVPDIAVTAPTQPNQALYILHLNTDGTVKSQVKNSDIPGQGLSAAGDLNGDGKIDLIAGNPGAAGGGAAQILFFDDASQLIAEDSFNISSVEGGFGAGLTAGDDFGGRESAVLGDIDGDGTIEVAVGAFQSNGGLGAIWILSLDSGSLNVVDKLKITSGEAGFDEVIDGAENPNGSFGGQFGHAMAAVGDLNGDGVPDLFTGANQHEEGYAYILYLNADKTVKTYTRINDSEGGFNLNLIDEGRFSRSMSSAGDFDSDGKFTVNVGGDAGGPGGVYRLDYQKCDFELEGVNTFWRDGAELFSNWSHANQTVTGPLTYEQCAAKTFELDGDKMTFSGVDRRCIIQDDTATLMESTEGSTAYLRQCS